MCGRYASSRSPDDLVEEFEVEENDLESDAGFAAGHGESAEATGPWAPKYNIAPTDTVPVVLERIRVPVADDAGTDESDDGDDHDREPVTPVGADPSPEPAARAIRRLRALTWGLVPSWSKERTGGARMINARAESLLTKPAYQRAALNRRCLVPADGWYEWQASPIERDSKGKPRKQPFFIHPAGGGGLALAGIYEFWRDQSLHADDPRAWLITFAVITTAAEQGLDVIHDRMPLVLPPDRWTAWLDPQLRDPDDVRALIEPPAPGRFAALAVTTRVNSVRNDGPELLEPAPSDQLIGVVDPATGELIGGTPVEPLF
jgi:putative SOS response-associated peptidase YedK